MKLWKILGVELYEVGDIFLNMSGKNPGLRFKGTWELIAQGRTLVGVDTTDSDFNTVGKTGGSKTHTLTVAELASHYHPLQGVYGSDANSANWESFIESYPQGGTRGSGPRGNFATVPIQNTGGGQAHNNLQPYLTTYIWERVS